MKENTVSIYNLEVITTPYTSYIDKKALVSFYNIELLVPYSNPTVFDDLDTPAYYFTGQILDQEGPVKREIISYNRATYTHMDTSFSSDTGAFLLDSTTSGICFIVALDDEEGTSYNHLVAAIVVPAVFDDYGFSMLNPGKSAKDIKLYNKAATFDGLYWIQPTEATPPIQVYCDMTTQGGGWMMCARWDRDFLTGWKVCLPLNAMRSNINIEDLLFTNKEGTSQSATLDIRTIIANGATTFMHVSMGTDDRTWKYTYFSDIYQVIRDNPDNLFNPSFDTNVGQGCTGTLVNKSSAEKTLWYDYDMSILTSYSLYNQSYNYCLSGGEGDGHFSIGAQPGAVYASHPSSDTATNNDYVLWGFYGKDNTVPASTFSYPMHVGTAKGVDYLPSCRFNFIFIR